MGHIRKLITMIMMLLIVHNDGHGDDHGDVNHLLLLPVQEEPDGAHSKTD